MILVVGGTGQVGQELVKQLQETKVPFRVLAHSARSVESLQAQGLEVVHGDYQQVASWAEAGFAGVERLFLLTPSSPDQGQIEAALIDQAKQAGVKHVVKISVWDIENPASANPLLTPHQEAEEHLRQSGLDYTLLRPNNFMQNFGRSDSATIKSQGAIYNASGDGLISFIDARDIAAVALAALTSQDHFGQAYTLAGPEALTYAQAAALFTKHLGKPVQHVSIPDEALKQALLGVGLTDWYAEGLVQLNQYYRQGYGATVNDNIKKITGRPAHTLDSYIADHLAIFKD